VGRRRGISATVAKSRKRKGECRKFEKLKLYQNGFLRANGLGGPSPGLGLGEAQMLTVNRAAPRKYCLMIKTKLIPHFVTSDTTIPTYKIIPIQERTFHKCAWFFRFADEVSCELERRALRLLPVKVRAQSRNQRPIRGELFIENTCKRCWTSNWGGGLLWSFEKGGADGFAHGRFHFLFSLHNRTRITAN
jgi:hypothetical protein